MANFTAGNLTRTSYTSNVIVPRGALDLWFGTVTAASAIGACASFCLFAAVCTARHQGGCTILIAHLVIIEFTMSAFHCPLSQIIVYLTQIGRDFYIDCNLVHCWHFLHYYAGNWAAAFLAVNRLVAMVFPTSYGYFKSKWTVVGMILLSWGFSLVSALPMYYKKIGNYGRFFPLGICSIRGYDASFAGIVAFACYIPYAVIGLCYGAVLVHNACRGVRRVSGFPTKSDQENRAMKKRVVVTRVLFLSSIWYAVCFSILPTVNAFLPRITQTNIVAFLWLRFVYLCGYVGSPIIFFSASAEYRKRYLTLFCLCVTKALEKKVHLSTPGPTQGSLELEKISASLPRPVK